ncbi:MAG TPA: hypothetical protein VFF27_16685 [Bacteroidia bacterium]|jgi:hypothetical protein|nr:hypothetical protein [Bacteroidia bacterium]
MSAQEIKIETVCLNPTAIKNEKGFVVADEIKFTAIQEVVMAMSSIQL